MKTIFHEVGIDLIPEDYRDVLWIANRLSMLLDHPLCHNVLSLYLYNPEHENYDEIFWEEYKELTNKHDAGNVAKFIADFFTDNNLLESKRSCLSITLISAIDFS